MLEGRPRNVHITSVTYERRSLFQVDATAELFLETLQHYRREGHYQLHAFVVMPDHVHLLITPLEITVERAIGALSREAFASAWFPIQGLAKGLRRSPVPRCGRIHRRPRIYSH
jgi:REP element-mobilizing transposase RayT